MSFSSDWVARAIALFEALKRENPAAMEDRQAIQWTPPLAAAELDEFIRTPPPPVAKSRDRWKRPEETVHRSMPYPLPGALREFYLEGASSIWADYSYDIPGRSGPDSYIFGGIEIVHPPLIQYNYDHFFPRTHAESELVWICTPFAHMSNGDYFGVINNTGEDNPLVVLLSHEDCTACTSLRFREFLLVWEQSCYMYPNFWEPSGLATYEEDRNWIEFSTPDVPGIVEYRDALFRKTTD